MTDKIIRISGVIVSGFFVVYFLWQLYSEVEKESPTNKDVIHAIFMATCFGVWYKIYWFATTKNKEE